MPEAAGHSDSTRERLLVAAVDVYSRGGSGAATTRRIAEHAGVNEVTLFRHFGSKDRLLEAALDRLLSEFANLQLPAEPRAPRTELLHWCSRVLNDLRGRAPVIRRCMAEAGERPELAGYVTAVPRHALAELTRYLRELQAGGLIDGSADPDAHAAGLVAAIFTDAVSRDMLPEILPVQRHAPALYVDTLLAALRVMPAVASVRARAAPPPSLPDATGA